MKNIVQFSSTTEKNSIRIKTTEANLFNLRCKIHFCAKLDHLSNGWETIKD